MPVRFPPDRGPAHSLASAGRRGRRPRGRRGRRGLGRGGPLHRPVRRSCRGAGRARLALSPGGLGELLGPGGGGGRARCGGLPRPARRGHARGRAHASRPSAVDVLCAESADRVRDLEALGVNFDADPGGGLALGLEGGHSRRRVAHAGGSATGRRITRCLSGHAAAHELIEILEETTVTALAVEHGRCSGLFAVPADSLAGDSEIEVRARGTVLATGGAAALWKRTTNPLGAVGRASRSHRRPAPRWPTSSSCSSIPRPWSPPTDTTASCSPRPCAARERSCSTRRRALRRRARSARRGRGGHRDRAADEACCAGRARPAQPRCLALSQRGQRARQAGLDPRALPVPVAPAAHYTMGGVASDLHGRSTLPGLLAVGECACTGLHGANRLAPNSLAECFVFGRRAAEAALDEPAPAAILGGGRVHRPPRSSLPRRDA